MSEMEMEMIAEEGELRRARDQEMRMAESLLYGVPFADEEYVGKMAAANAHATLALIRTIELGRRR